MKAALQLFALAVLVIVLAVATKPAKHPAQLQGIEIVAGIKWP